ncbi:hypothetical protein H6G97_34550 [Nostoc flagelliforme FACHB-838]|uniref:Uncharacterized protein n=1 Tax=Nostoc flagelliforme FACHB-838 TaxID=2692904 RepID=A0ABR8DY50_9NOSO|nr:hypothetical protein [Nostoc flagelliforme]MBD2534361.1 hypothetical protein [Nostoc flagelliforme FACHB-838]
MQQLRDILCTPQFQLNAEIGRTVKRCWDNVPGASLLAACRRHRLFQIGDTNLDSDQVMPWLYLSLLVRKGGNRRETQQAKSSVVAWFEWARRERIAIAMSGEVVYTPRGEGVAVAEMMRRFPVRE